jgi:translation elongation factor EF-1beta
VINIDRNRDKVKEIQIETREEREKMEEKILFGVVYAIMSVIIEETIITLYGRV